MNDRFRFRVWDTYLQSYNDCPKYNVAINIDQTFGMILTPFRNNIIEMCTGMKDKKGNLIYEGDIVKSMIRTGYIKWHKGDMTWYVYVLKSNEIIALNSYLDGELEIIGNIHEQAEQKEKK